MNDLLARTEGQLQTRSMIDELEVQMREMIANGAEEALHSGETDEGNAECDHYFGDGVYARGVRIKAGTTVVGKIHKLARVCIIAQGECTFVDEFHKETVKAPWVGSFKPGTKTAVFAHTDTYWVACVGTDIKDPQQAVAELSAKTYEDFEDFAASAAGKTA